MRIFTLGDIKHDTFIEVPDASLLCKKQDTSCSMAFAYGEKIPVGAFFSQFAGTAPNVAIGLTRLGHHAGVLSSLGTDYDAERALNFLREHHIDTEYISQKKHHRMTHAVVLNFRGESTQLVAHNDTKHTLPKKLPVPDLLHISEMSNGYRSVFADILAYQKKNKLSLSINPGVVQIKERSKELFALIKVSKVLFVNIKEAALLTKLSPSLSPKTLLTALLALGPHTAVMTDGGKGAYAAHQGRSLFAPVFPAVRKEATGAGDAFSAGVLGALLHDHSLAEALAWGAVNGASVVEYIGPTAGLLSARDIAKRLSDHESYRVRIL